MVLLKNFINIFLVPELRKKVLITLGILIVYRIGYQIPVIGVDVDKLKHLMEQATSASGILGYIDLVSGGALRQCTLFALGIMPYITSSIIMQMLTMTMPTLEQLIKEGEYGRKIINQYTRYLTFGVSLMQSFGYVLWVESSGLAITPGWAFRLLFMLSLTVGSMLVMWLGEQISFFGIGNGSSMIIFAGIVARFPTDFKKVWSGDFLSWEMAIVVTALFVAFAAFIVFLEKGERKIPVQYSRRIVGHRVYGGQSTYIPFKINTAGVMPVIFSSAVLNVPYFIAMVLSSRFEFFKNALDWMLPTSVLYNVIDFLLIILFTFVYTAMIFNPEELADNIKKSGGFIPGIRPGRKTAEFFNYILTRIGLIGALYLGLLAVMPNIVLGLVHIPFNVSFLGGGSGTSLLIVVSVALETAAQIESYLIEHRYEGFLTSGRLKMRGAR